MNVCLPEMSQAAPTRGATCERRIRQVRLGDVLAGNLNAVQPVAGVRHERADGQRAVRAQEISIERVHRLTGGARAGRGAVRAARDIQHRRLGLLPLLREEVRRIAVPVVLRHLVHEPHAVVEGQVRLRLPVVLDVHLVVDRQIAAFRPARLLAVGLERPDGRVGERERRVERVVGFVVGERNRAVERAFTTALHAVVVVVADLDRVRAHQPRDAGVEVAGLRIQNEVAEGTDVVRRRVGDAAGPRERRRHLHARAVPDGRTDRADDLVGKRGGVEQRRVRENVRNRAEAGRIAVRDRVDRQRVAAEVRTGAGHRAAFLVVVIAAPGELGERGVVDGPVDVRGRHPDAVVVFARVVPALKDALDGIGRLLVLEELEAAAQVRERLVVQADHRLVADQVRLRVRRSRSCTSAPPARR